MKILFVNAGNETGGGRTHMVQLLLALNATPDVIAELLVFEDSAVASMARANGLTVHVLEQKSQLDLSVLKRYRQFLAAGAYDVVHSHGARANLLTSLVKRALTGRWVITVHSDPLIDFSQESIKGRLFTSLNLRAMRQADRVFMITDALEPRLRQLRVPAKKLVPIFNAVPFDDRARGRVAHAGFNILHIGRLTPVKNQAGLIAAVGQQDYACHLEIVGDGELAADLQRQVDDQNLGDRVHLAGFSSRVDDYFKTADLFVLSSDSEGFPTVLLEAANWQVPSVATDVGSDHLIVKNGENGWIVQPGNTDALAAAIAQAHADFESGKLAEKGRAMFDYARQNFSIVHLATVTLDLYAGAGKKA